MKSHMNERSTLHFISLSGNRCRYDVYAPLYPIDCETTLRLEKRRRWRQVEWKSCEKSCQKTQEKWWSRRSGKSNNYTGSQLQVYYHTEVCPVGLCKPTLPFFVVQKRMIMDTINLSFIFRIVRITAMFSLCWVDFSGSVYIYLSHDFAFTALTSSSFSPLHHSHKSSNM